MSRRFNSTAYCIMMDYAMPVVACRNKPVSCTITSPQMFSPVEEKVSGRMTFRRQKVIRPVIKVYPRHEQTYPPKPINPRHEVANSSCRFPDYHLIHLHATWTLVDRLVITY